MLATLKMTAEECYAAVSKDIDKTVHAFRNRYQWDKDYEELRADANLSFMRCYNYTENGRRGDHTKGFNAAVRRWVWMELFDAYRREHHTQARNKRKFAEREDEATLATPPRQFFLFEFLESLTGDAKLVAELVVGDTGAFAPASVAPGALAKGGEPRNWRSTIRHYLHNLGWGRDRINTSFAELSHAL